MSTAPHPPAADHDPDLGVDIDTLIREVVPDPDTWKGTPNPSLGGYRPADLIGTPQEPILRNLLRAAKHGYIS
jgi:hypothetical protein